MPISVSVPSSGTVGTATCLLINGGGSQPPIVVVSTPGSTAVTLTPVLSGSVWEVCFTPSSTGSYHVHVVTTMGRTTRGFRVS